MDIFTKQSLVYLPNLDTRWYGKSNKILLIVFTSLLRTLCLPLFILKNSVSLTEGKVRDIYCFTTRSRLKEIEWQLLLLWKLGQNKSFAFKTKVPWFFCQQLFCFTANNWSGTNENVCSNIFFKSACYSWNGKYWQMVSLINWEYKILVHN